MSSGADPPIVKPPCETRTEFTAWLQSHLIPRARGTLDPGFRRHKRGERIDVYCFKPQNVSMLGSNRKPIVILFCSQSFGFSSGHVWMWELDYQESSVLKNWCFWTVVLEKTLEGPLDCREIKPVNSKGDQSWVFIGRTDAEAPILCLPDVKNWLLGKDSDAGKDKVGEGEERRWDGGMASQTVWTSVWASSRVGDRHGSLAKSWTWLSNWTESCSN